MTGRRLLIALATVALLGVACGGDDGGGGGSAGGGDEDGGGGGTVTLSAANFAFEPTSLSAAVGDTIELTNEDDAAHNFTAEEADLDEDVDAGSSTSIDLSDVEPGSYDFLCKFHPDSMTGTLEVTE
jgi:plastocyanin